MPSGAMAAIITVWPSGGALATAAVPIRLAAPAMLSSTNGCPRRLASASPISRAMASATPPGEAGTTMRTGFDGQAAAGSCADAGETAALAMAMPASTSRTVARIVVLDPASAGRERRPDPLRQHRRARRVGQRRDELLGPGDPVGEARLHGGLHPLARFARGELVHDHVLHPAGGRHH